MIRALRRTSLASAIVAVALFATMPVTISSLLHDMRDDAQCNPALVAHDPDAHQVAAPGQSSQDSQHCVLCHALQSLRAVQTSVRFSPSLLDVRLFAVGAIAPAQTLFAVSRPARAPPLA